jgi:MoxR-like ATPase
MATQQGITASRGDSGADPQARALAFRDDFARLREEVGRVVVGQGPIVEAALIGVFAGGHVLLEGVPGIGKTLLVRTLAQSLSLSFSRVQFTPDLMPADITGTTIVAEEPDDAGRVVRRFRFQPGPVFAQILLADEINRATPKTQSALLEAMQERGVTVAGTTHPLPRPFMVLATQNPVEQEGTYPLPEAQLDRFLFKILVGAPSRAELSTILDRTTGGVTPAVQSVLAIDRILAHQELVRAVPIAPTVQDYAVRLVLATHPDSTGLATPQVRKFVRLGASPRAAQAMVLAAKCKALIDGRFAPSIEDLRDVALPALRHRLILNFEAHADGVTADTLVQNLVATLPVDAP